MCAHHVETLQFHCMTCAYARVRFQHKNHLVQVFVSKYLFWLAQTQLGIVPRHSLKISCVVMLTNVQQS